MPPKLSDKKIIKKFLQTGNSCGIVYNVPQGTAPVGVYSDEGPPVPIPNTAVKLISADNTWGAAPWEDRATPT